MGPAATCSPLMSTPLAMAAEVAAVAVAPAVRPVVRWRRGQALAVGTAATSPLLMSTPLSPIAAEEVAAVAVEVAAVAVEVAAVAVPPALVRPVVRWRRGQALRPVMRWRWGQARRPYQPLRRQHSRSSSPVLRCRLLPWTRSTLSGGSWTAWLSRQRRGPPPTPPRAAADGIGRQHPCLGAHLRPYPSPRRRMHRHPPTLAPPRSATVSTAVTRPCPRTAVRLRGWLHGTGLWTPCRWTIRGLGQ